MAINFNYLVASAGFEDDREGNVILCDTFEEAKKIGTKIASYESDPFINIWELQKDKGLVLIAEGFIPEPTFSWHNC